MDGRMGRWTQKQEPEGGGWGEICCLWMEVASGRNLKAGKRNLWVSRQRTLAMVYLG